MHPLPSGKTSSRIGARKRKTLTDLKAIFDSPCEPLALEKQLGAGAFGTVYRSRNSSGQLVAVKQVIKYMPASVLCTCLHTGLTCVCLHAFLYPCLYTSRSWKTKTVSTERCRSATFSRPLEHYRLQNIIYDALMIMTHSLYSTSSTL